MKIEFKWYLYLGILMFVLTGTLLGFMFGKHGVFIAIGIGIFTTVFGYVVDKNGGMDI